MLFTYSVKFWPSVKKVATKKIWLFFFLFWFTNKDKFFEFLFIFIKRNGNKIFNISFSSLIRRRNILQLSFDNFGVWAIFNDIFFLRVILIRIGGITTFVSSLVYLHMTELFCNWKCLNIYRLNTYETLDLLFDNKNFLNFSSQFFFDVFFFIQFLF